MREILFRAKDRGGDWQFGFLTAEYGYSVTHFDLQILTREGLPFCIQSETVGQFTGLKDKNGVKIFEGDICESETLRWIILWENERFILRCGDSWRTLEYFAGVSNIIGNIFDNPELLN